MNWNDCTKDCKCTGFTPYRIKEQEETKHKGKGRKHISYGMLNKRHSEATKRKISEVKIGRPRSEETKRKNLLPEPLSALPTLVQFLDLFGTMAIAVTGAFKAIAHISDIVGIIILSTITGVAGGIIRDITLGRIPPNAIVNPLYIIVTVSVAIIIFFVYPSLKKYRNLFLKFDAIGLVYLP